MGLVYVRVWFVRGLSAHELDCFVSAHMYSIQCGVAAAIRMGQVRGYVAQPEVRLPPNDKGKLDVSRAVRPMPRGDVLNTR